MDAEERELAELLHEEELADEEVARVVASMQQAESSGGRPTAPVMRLERDDSETPAVSTERKPDDDVVSEYYLRMIRRKLYEFFVYKKEVPTIEKLQRVLKREFNFSCSRRALLKVLRDDGFRLAGRQELIRMPTGSARAPSVPLSPDKQQKGPL